MYRIDRDAIVILEVFTRKSQRTPNRVMEACRQRLKAYDDLK
jgi:phage-related protein